MKLLSKLGLLVAGAAVGACSSTTPTTPVVPVATDIGGQATHVGSTYSAIQDGALTAIPGSPSTFNGQPLWLNTGTHTVIAGYESSNVLALGGYNSGSLIKGVTGVLSSPAQTGTATYVGRYVLVSPSTEASSALNTDVDFGAGTIAASTPSGIVVSGTITGQQYAGTVTVNGISAPLEGGFFGTNEMAGSFGNSIFAGVIYGTK